MRGVTSVDYPQNLDFLFQLTRLMRGVTDYLLLVKFDNLISTHTPHARRDKHIPE